MNFVEDVAQGKAQLLDVRSKLEWKMGHAKGAVRIGLNDVIDGKTDSLDPDMPVYVYCASGARSSSAEQALRQQGFKATNIGGLANWAQAGGAIAR